MTEPPATCDRTWPAGDTREDTYPQHRCTQTGDHVCRCKYCGAVRPVSRWGR